MKVCTKCLVNKNTTDYFVRDKSAGRLHAQCKSCYREHRKTYQEAHYQKYKEAYKERARLRRHRLKRINQEHLIGYMKDKSCQTCRENDIRVLEFDHIDPLQKSFSIARAINDGLDWKDILIEIEKCNILCSNCHKKRTATQYGWFKAIGL